MNPSFFSITTIDHFNKLWKNLFPKLFHFTYKRLSNYTMNEIDTMGVFVLGENHFQKCFFGNAGVWLVQKIEFSGNWFPLTEKKRLWLRKWISVPIFTSNEFRREREKEREWARERKASSSPVRRSSANPELQSTPIARTSRSRELQSDDHDLAKHCADRRFARSASIAISRSIASSNPIERRSLMIFFFFGFCSCFFGFVFSFFFSKHHKIFFGNFFEMQPNTWKHFPFRKMEYFPEMLLHEPNTA